MSFSLFIFFVLHASYIFGLSTYDDNMDLLKQLYKSNEMEGSVYSSFVGQRVISFQGIPNNSSLEVELSNGKLMNETLANLIQGDVLHIQNQTYHIMGGIVASGLRNVTIVLDGTLIFSTSINSWPRSEPNNNGAVLECLYFKDIWNVRFTSSVSYRGRLDGNGNVWWGIPGIGYLIRGENRPRLLHIDGANNVLIEKLDLINSPYWTLWAPNSNGLEIRYTNIDARRDQNPEHNIIDLTAFNTDGFDVTGENVYIHDSQVWNQDDCVCVKDGSSNMLFERITASGLGLTIGSIGGSTVNNITFRDIYMPHTFKGIYMKFRGDGLIQNILFENITMDQVEQYPIWIGPAQQSDSGNLCAAHPCSLCWPLLPGAACDMPSNSKFVNITLKDVKVNGSKNSPGVILANLDSPIENLVFDNVIITGAGTTPFGSNYKCENIGSDAFAKGNTNPIPDCFNKLYY